MGEFLDEMNDPKNILDEDDEKSLRLKQFMRDEIEEDMRGESYAYEKDKFEAMANAKKGVAGSKAGQFEGASVQPPAPVKKVQGYDDQGYPLPENAVLLPGETATTGGSSSSSSQFQTLSGGSTSYTGQNKKQYTDEEIQNLTDEELMEVLDRVRLTIELSTFLLLQRIFISLSLCITKRC